jgi:hypothetical protein
LAYKQKIKILFCILSILPPQPTHFVNKSLKKNH